MRYLLLFTLVGCVQTSSVMAPDGKAALLLECRNGIDSCLHEAEDACPRGYDVLSQAWGSGRTPATLLIRCKSHLAARE